MCAACNTDRHLACASLKQEDTDNGVLFLCCCVAADEGATVIKVKGPGGRTFKDQNTLKDQQSTGRKRAAIAAPLDREAPCEWQGLLNAGGGVRPIVGCREGKQQDRHHGPDKSTLNNDVGVNLHRICKTCVTEGMRLLTEDLRWEAVENLKVGDRLIGFSEDIRAVACEFEPAIVESIEKGMEPSYRLTVGDGTTMVVSHNHQWVGSRPNDLHAKWLTTEKLMNKRSAANYTLKRLVKPWDEDRSYDAGWLAGFLDGEGSLTGYTLAVGQSELENNSLVTDKMYEALYARAKNITETHRPAQGNTGAFWWLRLTKLHEILSLVGSVRPIKLLGKVPDFLYEPTNGRDRKKNPIPVSDRVEVVKIEYVGMREVYSVQTSSSTYIVEGYLSHNCHNRWHAFNDVPYYGQTAEDRPEYGKPWVPLEYVCLPHDPLTKATIDQQWEAEVFLQTAKTDRKLLEDDHGITD